MCKASFSPLLQHPTPHAKTRLNLQRHGQCQGQKGDNRTFLYVPERGHKRIRAISNALGSGRGSVLGHQVRHTVLELVLALVQKHPLEAEGGRGGGELLLFCHHGRQAESKAPGKLRPPGCEKSKQSGESLRETNKPNKPNESAQHAGAR